MTGGGNQQPPISRTPHDPEALPRPAPVRRSLANRCRPVTHGQSRNSLHLPKQHFPRRRTARGHGQYPLHALRCGNWRQCRWHVFESTFNNHPTNQDTHETTPTKPPGHPRNFTSRRSALPSRARVARSTQAGSSRLLIEPGKMASQRSATSRSAHSRAARGSLRRTTWK